MNNKFDNIKAPIEGISRDSNDNSDIDTERVSSDETKLKREKERENAIDAELNENRKWRDYHEETWLYWVRIIAICITAFLSFSVLSIYWWHLVGGASLRWLCLDDLNRIEKIAATIVVGIVGTLSASYFLQKRTKK